MGLLPDESKARGAGEVQINYETANTALTAGDAVPLAEVEGTGGYLEFFAIQVDRNTATLRIEIDGKKMDFLISKMRDLGLVFPCERFPWLSKYDAVGSLFVIAYQSVIGERFKRSMSVSIIAPAGDTMNIISYVVKYRPDDPDKGAE